MSSSVVHKTTDDAPHPLGDRTFQFVVSTSALDRDKDRIRADGWDTSEYMRNPVVPFAHDYKSLPVARTVSLRQDGDRLVAAAQFPPKHVYPFADTVHDMVQAGFLTGASAGFMPGEYVTNAWGGRDYIKGHKLLEWSVVPIPSNPQATRVPTTRAAAYDMTMKNFLGITDSRVLRLTPHRVGLDEVTMKAFLHEKSDMHPTQYCSNGLRCPSKAGQLPVSQCPARGDCPLQATGKDAVFDLDLADRAAIKEAMQTELRRQALAMSKGLVAEVARPLLREHLQRTTGRVD